MPLQLATLGDNGFTGLNSRDNPNALPQKYISEGSNIRLDRGVVSSRKGAKRLIPTELGDPIWASCIFTDTSGVDYVVMACTSSLKRYNTVTGALTSTNWPGTETITASQKVDMVQAGGQVFIVRGYAHRPMIWDGASTITLMQSGSGSYHKFPNGSQLIYNGNRLIVVGSAGWDKTSGTSTGDINDEIQVSHYLQFDEFSLLDVFKINDGSNDYIVGVAPWVLNEFVVFMRNRIYYCSVGAGAEASGHAIDAADSYVKVLATDVGCVAPKSIVQANGGMLFLSDNGVYAMVPSQATTPEGMRVGMVGEPLSAPVQNIIDRLNLEHAHKAVGSYFDNRYYLAMPVNDEEVLLPCIVTYEAAVAPATDNNLVFTAEPGKEDQFQKYLATISQGDTLRSGILVPSLSPSYLIQNYVVSEKTATSFKLNIGMATYSGSLQQIARFQKLVTRNNKVIVFNFTNKAWESLDFYTPGFDILSMHVARYGNKRRLHMIDQEEGVFVAEENEFWDEYTVATNGNNIFTIDKVLAGLEFGPEDMVFDFPFLETGLTQYPVDSYFVSRGYNGETNSDKRYSSMEMELYCPQSAIVQTSVITDNPDTEVQVDRFGAPIADEHSRNRPLRKKATSLRVRVRFFKGRSQVRSLYLSVTDPGRNIISRD